MFRTTHRWITALSLAASLGTPALLVGAAVPQDRVYDRQHKDYHQWDEHENQAWHRFLVENHREEHEFAKANRKEQAEYWNWRHNHPD
jgi:hypothetical protein